MWLFLYDLCLELSKQNWGGITQCLLKQYYKSETLLLKINQCVRLQLIDFICLNLRLIKKKNSLKSRPCFLISLWNSPVGRNWEMFWIVKNLRNPAVIIILLFSVIMLVIEVVWKTEYIWQKEWRMHVKCCCFPLWSVFVLDREKRKMRKTLSTISGQDSFLSNN